MYVGTQLRVGEGQLRTRSLAEIGGAIRRARDLAGIDSIMIDSACDLALGERLVLSCRDCGVQPYLWFPVLADVPAVTFGEHELLKLYDGSRGQGRIGAWEGLGSGPESFLFCCPNCQGAVDRILRVFTGLLDRLGFAGVMLDKIRYPSAVSGIESLFGCYCGGCSTRWREAFGTPLEQQRRRVASLVSDLGRPAARTVGSRECLDTLWEEAGLGELFRFKARSIAAIAERFAAEARTRGLRVGLDLFSPSLSPVVSQDYGLLSRSCDWIKPMIYCHAVAPAGLPLEVACLQRALRAARPGLSDGEIRGVLRGLLPWDWPESEASLLGQGLPEDVITAELRSIGRMRLAPGVRIYAGLEAVRDPEFRIDVTEKTLQRGLARARDGADGVIASWDLLQVPEENLKALGAFGSQG